MIPPCDHSRIQPFRDSAFLRCPSRARARARSQPGPGRAGGPACGHVRPRQLSSGTPIHVAPQLAGIQTLLPRLRPPHTESSHTAAKRLIEPSPHRAGESDGVDVPHGPLPAQRKPKHRFSMRDSMMPSSFSNTKRWWASTCDHHDMLDARGPVGGRRKTNGVPPRFPDSRYSICRAQRNGHEKLAFKQLLCAPAERSEPTNNLCNSVKCHNPLIQFLYP